MKTKTQHTPGPWAVARIYIDRKYKKYEVEPNIARIFYAEDVGEANARLIAASPELLAAAKRVKACLLKYGLPPDAIEEWDDSLASLGKAIAKAEDK